MKKLSKTSLKQIVGGSASTTCVFCSASNNDGPTVESCWGGAATSNICDVIYGGMNIIMATTGPCTGKCMRVEASVSHSELS